jgi:SAM-dependent methyltransferase
VGCGSGGFLRVATALGYDARGIEFDPSAAALAQANGFEVQVGTISEADVAAASVDQITLNHVIEHLYEPVAALQRMGDWLRQGGRIWLQTPNVDGAGAQRYGGDWRGLEPPRHLVMFGPRSLRLALERAGFERIALLPPHLDSAFYIEQSEGIRAERDPYSPDRQMRRAARWEGREWDIAALARPERAESITMVGFKPA